MANLEDITDLLEREEKKAKERVKNLAEQSAVKDGSDDTAMGGMDIDIEPRPAIRDPRRLERPSDLDAPTSKRRLSQQSNHSGQGNNGRSSQNRYTSEREENDERRARRSRDHGDDDAANGASDRDSANGSARGRRHRTRSPTRPGSRGNDYRHRSPRRGDHYPGSAGRGGRRSIDRDHSTDRWRPRGDDRGARPERGGRDDDRSRRDGDRHGRRDGGRDNGRRRSPPPSGRDRKTPEPTDDERDRRTVFVQQLAARLRSRELKEFFEQAGSVVDAQIVKDRVSKRSKGVGYVEFKDEESVQKAIALTGQKLLGIPIIAQLTEAEKNRQAKTNEGGATQSNGIPFHRLYVGNIHFSINEDDLKNVFEPFGELEFVQLQKEEQGRSKGYGFVQFIDPAQAKEALEKMNGFELAGRPIRVGLGNDKFTPESTRNLMQGFGERNQTQGSSFSGMGGRGAHAGGTGNFDRSTARDQDKTGGASALDDTDVGGVNFSNYSRDALMRKLARTDEPEQKMAPRTTQQQRKPAIIEQNPTRCVLLKNVYDQNAETDPNWQKDIKDDIKEECEAKYGKVAHIDLALDNNDGEVYIKFANVEGGKNAILGLQGRSFGFHKITAQYVVDAVYNMNFPKATNV